MNKQPKFDTFPGKVCEFFRNNELEELSTYDIAVKFGGGPRGVHSKLAGVVADGLLVRKADDDQGYVYIKGPKLMQGLPPEAYASPDEVQPASATTVRTASKPPAHERAPLPDPATVPLESGIAVPQGRSGTKLDWTKLLDRMDVGHSAFLPKQARAMLSKCMSAKHKAGKARFSLRAADEAHIRVWRTA